MSMPRPMLVHVVDVHDQDIGFDRAMELDVHDSCLEILYTIDALNIPDRTLQFGTLKTSATTMGPPVRFDLSVLAKPVYVAWSGKQSRSALAQKQSSSAFWALQIIAPAFDYGSDANTKGEQKVQATARTSATTRAQRPLFVAVAPLA
jgi:hypothetical protein